MALIKDNCRGEGEKIMLEILGKWVRGGGMSVTWETLITALRKCELLLLADQIEMALKKRYTVFFSCADFLAVFFFCVCDAFCDGRMDIRYLAESDICAFTFPRNV